MFDKKTIPSELIKYDYRDNLIIDEDNPILIQKAWRDHFSKKSYWLAGYGGQAYLSKPNSEDALTWNVFRTLQISGEAGLNIISNIFNISKVQTVLYWGCDVEHGSEEQQLLNILIRLIDGRYPGVMTEPDLVFITDEEVVFVECKLNLNGNVSPWKSQSPGSEKRWKIYIENFPELNTCTQWKAVYQLIRQYVYSKSLGFHLNKKSLVIPLINEKHKDVLSEYYSIIKMMNQDVFRDFVTWQDVHKNLETSNIKNKKMEELMTKMRATLQSVK